MPANWNSYSKSETALSPLNIIVALYFEQICVVKALNDIISILLELNFELQNFDMKKDSLNHLILSIN